MELYLLVRRNHALGHKIGHGVHALQKFLAAAWHAKTDVVDVATGAVGHDRDKSLVFAQCLLNQPGKHREVIRGHPISRHAPHVVQRIIGQECNRPAIDAAQ